MKFAVPVLLRGHLLHDRRQYARLVPGSSLLVHLGASTGVVSNLCEGGLAVKSSCPEMQGEVLCLEVELPDSSSPMQSLAQITWTGNSENLTGVQFLDLPATSRQQLREWMSTQAAARVVQEGPPTFRASARKTQLDLAAVHRPLTSGVEPTELEAARRRAGLRRLIGLVLTAATLWSALFTLGLYLASRSLPQWTRWLAPVATTADNNSSGQVEAAKLSREKNPLPFEEVPLNAPGFVLQVGAMTNESDADALSETLQRNGFPAFVFKRLNDRFYKVAVGPFADANSAAVVKRKLEKQGFKATLRPWSPE